MKSPGCIYLALPGLLAGTLQPGRGSHSHSVSKPDIPNNWVPQPHAPVPSNHLVASVQSYVATIAPSHIYDLPNSNQVTAVLRHPTDHFAPHTHGHTQSNIIQHSL